MSILEAREILLRSRTKSHLWGFQLDGRQGRNRHLYPIETLEKKVKVKATQSSPTLWDPMDCRLLCPWNSSSKNIGVGSLSILQGIFLTQELNSISCIAGRFFTSWTTREAHRDTWLTLFSLEYLCENYRDKLKKCSAKAYANPTRIPTRGREICNILNTHAPSSTKHSITQLGGNFHNGTSSSG